MGYGSEARRWAHPFVARSKREDNSHSTRRMYRVFAPETGSVALGQSSRQSSLVKPFLAFHWTKTVGKYWHLIGHKYVSKERWTTWVLSLFLLQSLMFILKFHSMSFALDRLIQITPGVEPQVADTSDRNSWWEESTDCSEKWNLHEGLRVSQKK